MAAKLMQKYNLDSASVVLKDLEEVDAKKDFISEMWSEISDWSKLPGWMTSLSIAVADLFDCKVRLSWDRRVRSVNKRPYTNFVFFGHKTDVQVCQWTFSFLVDQINRASSNFVGGKLDKISFREGASNMLRRRLAQMLREKKEAENSNGASTSFDLVVLKKQQILVEKFGAFNYTERAAAQRDRFAYESGMAAGARMNINRPIGGSGGSANKRIEA